MKTRIRFALFVVAVVLIAPLFMACTDVKPSEASCGFVVNDRKLRTIVYPGQKVEKKDGDEVSYVPCNSRNFIVTDGTVRDANGEAVGDRQQLITATTENGVQIEVAVSAYWTLNQSESAMRNFYTVCLKYQCASGSDKAGTANNSTPGWNDMLGENFNPALERTLKLAASESKDTIWSTQDPEEYKKLADRMAALFADQMRATLGYSDDLFCGSGNSAWSDPEKPGEGTFACSPVRFVVDDVRRGNIRSDESTEGAVSINEQRLKNAKALYGDSAGYWLGLQDAIEKCVQAGTTCHFYIGGAPSAPAIPSLPNVPSTSQ